MMTHRGEIDGVAAMEAQDGTGSPQPQGTAQPRLLALDDTLPLYFSPVPTTDLFDTLQEYTQQLTRN